MISNDSFFIIGAPMIYSEAQKNEIIEKTFGISLSDLGLSNRLYNCLRRGGYDTLTDIMLEEPDNFMSIRNFGVSCSKEIEDLRVFILNSNRLEIIKYCEEHGSFKPSDDIDFDPLKSKMTVLETALYKGIEIEKVLFINQKGEYVEDIPIVETSISNKTKHVLIAENIRSLKDLVTMDFCSFVSIRRMGKTKIEEIMAYLKNPNNLVEKSSFENACCLAEDIISYYSTLFDEELLRRQIDFIISDTDRYIKENDCSSDSICLADIAKTKTLLSLIERKIMNAVSNKIFMGVEKDLFISLVANQETKYYPIIEDILDNMINDKLVRIVSGKVYKYKLFLNEWINELEANKKLALQYRTDGMTLEEIGNIIGLTRERVRQLVSKCINKRPPLYEEDYIEFISRYNFTNDEFCSLFELNKNQINFILLLCNKGTEDLQTFIFDESIPGNIKDRITNAFKNKIIILDGECITVKRDILIKSILKIYFSDTDCSIDEFEDFYYKFLYEHQLNTIESLRFPSKRALEARLIDYPYALSKAGRCIRYYDISSINIDDLLYETNLFRYKNQEISTLKIFRESKDVMEKYDIRDEYELHNIIRKKQEEIQNFEIKVLRMPFICVGTGDRIKQVEDLLLQMAPVSNTDLANEYERLYGVRAETVLANFFKCIDVFFHNGMFDLEQVDLSKEDYRLLRNELTDDIYLWDTIKEMYLSISKCPKQDAINAMTLKKLGFRVYSQYVIKDAYSSAEAYFKSVLLKDELIDINTVPNIYRTIQSFYSTLSDLKDNLDLIEIAKDVYCRLDYFFKMYSIESKTELQIIGSEFISNFDREEYYSASVVASKYYDYNMPSYCENPYILNSLLRINNNLKSGRISNSYIITKKENDLSQIGLIIYIIRNHNGEISVSDLITLLSEKYNIKIAKSRILFLADSSNLVMYDSLFDNVVLREDYYQNQLYLSNTHLAEIIKAKDRLIHESTALIEHRYWKDKYSGFVKYCFEHGFVYMKDVLSLDFREIIDNAYILNISRNSVSEIVNIFVEWINGLDRIEEGLNNDAILDFFFK